jgi:hypothetical protein
LETRQKLAAGQQIRSKCEKPGFPLYGLRLTSENSTRYPQRWQRRLENEIKRVLRIIGFLKRALGGLETTIARSPGGHNVEVEIDYPAVVDALQHENERLRLRIFAIRQQSVFQALGDMIDLARVKRILEKNYIAIAAVSMIVLVVATIIGFLR